MGEDAAEAQDKNRTQKLQNRLTNLPPELTGLRKGLNTTEQIQNIKLLIEKFTGI